MFIAKPRIRRAGKDTPLRLIWRRLAPSPQTLNEWPVHDIGEYRFLGQINFSEIQNGPASLPKVGLLSLFYAFDENGEVFWGDDGYVLGYYWPNTEELSLYPDPEGVVQARKILLQTGVEIPRHEELRQDWPFDTDALYAIQDLEGICDDYILGYPSHSSLAYDPTPGEDWVSLLTLSSHDELEWCWHDGDKLMIFIEKSKLIQKDFGNLKSDAG
ncbi:YwqG family protein [Hahella chejuensis]|uniref:YwqG family protein n=1 Tax=Hahella chejuensis TaxID=158327 RepID=UPI001305195F|nr:DUF1963 domain-containing protein [Hahella chejuensis]